LVSLPAMCGALAGDLSNSSQEVLRRQVGALAESDLPEEAKVVLLGLSLMDVVGRDVLKSAVGVLAQQIGVEAALASVSSYVPPAQPRSRAASARLEFPNANLSRADGDADDPVQELPAGR